jgi:hypothetical protein
MSVKSFISCILRIVVHKASFCKPYEEKYVKVP